MDEFLTELVSGPNVHQETSPATAKPGYREILDINDDGKVNFYDVAIILGLMYAGHWLFSKLKKVKG